MILLAFTHADIDAALWTIAVGLVCNLSCALLGCFLVLRRMSLVGDAISHAVLPGIALAVLFTGQITSTYILLGAMIFGMLTAFLSESLNAFAGVSEDASLGIVFTSFFALGVILISKVFAHTDLDPGCVFLGNLEMVPLDKVDWLGMWIPRAFPTMLLGLVLTAGFISLFWKELKLSSLDPALAAAMGFSPRLVHYLLIALVAGVVVASFEAVGSILVIPLLIVPAATAHLLCDRLAWMLAWSALLSITCTVLGYVLASRWLLNVNVGGMMASVALAQFFLAVLFAPRHGIVAKVLRTLWLSLRIASEDILARLYRLEEKGTEAPTLTESNPWITRVALGQLRRRGWIRYQDGSWALTSSGRQPAASIVRAHRLWEAFLGEHFELPLDHLHAAAERMEHYLDPGLQSELAQALLEPQRDPHGKSIPPS